MLGGYKVFKGYGFGGLGCSIGMGGKVGEFGGVSCETPKRKEIAG